MLANQSQVRIAFLLVGGMHHILHLIPPVSELIKSGDIDVVVYVRKAHEREICRSVLQRLGVIDPDVRILGSPRILEMASPKLSPLIWNYRTFRQFDALVVAERTSTILRYLPGRLPTFIHTPHGAGDRAVSFDSRIRHFDHVLVAGEKDKARMIAKGIANHENCHVTGYVKPYVIRRFNDKLPELFSMKRPVIFYNPHFDETLSSWNEFGMDLLQLFAQESAFNFIVAPHIRLFDNSSEAERKTALEFHDFDNIHIDLGSPRSTDMTYSRMADIYLGDVSSQVYEFLSEPKPCVFLGTKSVAWQDNPDYAHWRYGRVCHSPADAITALKSAFSDHPSYRDTQVAGCRAAVGDANWNPIARSAETIRSILRT